MGLILKEEQVFLGKGIPRVLEKSSNLTLESIDLIDYKWWTPWSEEVIMPYFTVWGAIGDI